MDRLLKVVLDIVPKSTNAFTKALGGGGGVTGGKISPQATSEALGKVTDGFSKLHKELNLLNTAIRPDLIKKQADLELRQDAAQRKYDKALYQAKGGFLGAAGRGIAAHPFAAAGGVLAGGMAAVGARSPATMERFERALLDTTAVIGDTFAPVMDLASEGIRLFGDFLASVLPDANEMREILKPLQEGLKDLRSVLTQVAPTIKDILVVALEGFGVALMAAGEVLKLFTIDSEAELERLKSAKEKAWYNPSRGAQFGDSQEFLDKQIAKYERIVAGGGLKNSRGMAATSASYVGGEERGKAAYAAAFAGGAVEAAMRTADNTERIARATEKLAGMEGGGGGWRGRSLEDLKAIQEARRGSS